MTLAHLCTKTYTSILKLPWREQIVTQWYNHLPVIFSIRPVNLIDSLPILFTCSTTVGHFAGQTNASGSLLCSLSICTTIPCTGLIGCALNQPWLGSKTRKLLIQITRRELAQDGGIHVTQDTIPQPEREQIYLGVFTEYLINLLHKSLEIYIYFIIVNLKYLAVKIDI